MDSFLSDPESRNWLRACLALKCARDALIPLVMQHCDDLYSNNNKNVIAKCHSEYTCTNCDVDNLKQNRPCPANGSCNVVYDHIKACHYYKKPKWCNTNCGRWAESGWEQLKSFIFTKGYTYKIDIDEADTTAIVQIVKNFIPMRKLLGANGVKVLEKVCDIRNELCHSTRLKVSSGDLKGYIAHIKTCLKLNVFKDYESEINQQLEKLQDLEKDHTEITPAVVQIALLDVKKVSTLSIRAATILKKLLQIPEVIANRNKTEDARFEEMNNRMVSQDSKLQEILEVLKKNATAQPVNDKVSTDDSAKSQKSKAKVEKRKLAPDELIKPVLKKFKQEGKPLNIRHEKVSKLDDSAKSQKPKVKVEKRKLAPDELVIPVLKTFKQEVKPPHHEKEPDKISSEIPIPPTKRTTSLGENNPNTRPRFIPLWSTGRLPGLLQWRRRPTQTGNEMSTRPRDPIQRSTIRNKSPSEILISPIDTKNFYKRAFQISHRDVMKNTKDDSYNEERLRRFCSDL